MQTTTELKKRKIAIVGKDGYGRIVKIIDTREIEYRNPIHLTNSIQKLTEELNASENKLKTERLDAIEVLRVGSFKNVAVDKVAVALNSYFMIGERKQREQTQKIVQQRREARLAQKAMEQAQQAEYKA